MSSLEHKTLKELLLTLMWQNLTWDNFRNKNLWWSCEFFYLPLPVGGIENPLVNYSVVNIFYSLCLIHWTFNIKKNRRWIRNCRICSVMWVTDEIICISFRPAVAKPLPHVPKCISLGCETSKITFANLSGQETEKLRSLGISGAHDFADAALQTPVFLSGLL